MALKLMYITNLPEVAKIAEKTGVDRIFVDMEYIGKYERQGNLDTVKNHHTIEDIRKIKDAVSVSKVMVRVNPIHESSLDYSSSKEEIDEAINAGADIIMLPYFKTVKEVRYFLQLINKRVKTLLLVETVEAVENIDAILNLEGVDEVLIGLNDLSLEMHKKFMFELLADGTVETLTLKFKKKGIPYGFGGIASLGKGLLPAEYVIKEHYRLGSTCAILSRSFCNINQMKDLNSIESVFVKGIKEIRDFEKECEFYAKYFRENERIVAEKVKQICETLQ